MKKISSLALILLIVLSSVNFAFASDLSSDIKDINVKKAVERLEAFGIVNGLEDGKYHPEKEITREQFMAIVVRALGLETAASMISDIAKPKFSDIEADRWSLGYIEVGANLEIIKGMEDGTFAPTNSINYAEAITVLVRSLGYKDEFLSGSWPDNYLIKAAELNIIDDMEFDSFELANRGSIAVLVNNTLNAKVLKEKTYSIDSNSIESRASDDSTSQNRQAIIVYDEVQIAATHKEDSSLKENEVKIKFLKDTEDGKYKKDAVKIFKMNSSIDIQKLLEQKAVIFIDVHNVILDIEKQESQEKQE